MILYNYSYGRIIILPQQQQIYVTCEKNLQIENKLHYKMAHI